MRQLYAAALAISVASSFACRPPPSPQLTVVTYGGGEYQKSHIDAFLKPFEKASGAKTQSVVWGAEFARLSEMVRSADPSWDVVEVTAAQFARGKRDGLFAKIVPPLEPDTFKTIDGAPPVSDVGVPNVYWSTVLAYRKDAFPQPPQEWKDFWDTQKYPGARAMYDDPRGNLEFALLADGVPLRELYPLDVERAFAKLQTLRPHIRVWWKDGTEAVRLLLTQQVDMSSAWSGRIFASAQARQNLGYAWRGAAHELDYWVIPKSSAQQDLSSQFIKLASSAGPMARQAELTAYGPANALALDKVDKQVLPHLPTTPANWDVSFVIDADWWAQNEANITSRWVQWRNQ